jgi:hypothetical protein
MRPFRALTALALIATGAVGSVTRVLPHVQAKLASLLTCAAKGKPAQGDDNLHLCGANVGGVIDGPSFVRKCLASHIRSSSRPVQSPSVTPEIVAYEFLFVCKLPGVNLEVVISKEPRKGWQVGISEFFPRLMPDSRKLLLFPSFPPKISNM